MKEERETECKWRRMLCGLQGGVHVNGDQPYFKSSSCWSKEIHLCYEHVFIGGHEMRWGGTYKRKNVPSSAARFCECVIGRLDSACLFFFHLFKKRQASLYRRIRHSDCCIKKKQKRLHQLLKAVERSECVLVTHSFSRSLTPHASSLVPFSAILLAPLLHTQQKIPSSVSSLPSSSKSHLSSPLCLVRLIREQLTAPPLHMARDIFALSHAFFDFLPELFNQLTLHQQKRLGVTI